MLVPGDQMLAFGDAMQVDDAVIINNGMHYDVEVLFDLAVTTLPVDELAEIALDHLTPPELVDVGRTTLGVDGLAGLARGLDDDHLLAGIARGLDDDLLAGYARGLPPELLGQLVPQRVDVDEFCGLMPDQLGLIGGQHWFPEYHETLGALTGVDVAGELDFIGERARNDDPVRTPLRPPFTVVREEFLDKVWPPDEFTAWMTAALGELPAWLPEQLVRRPAGTAGAGRAGVHPTHVPGSRRVRPRLAGLWSLVSGLGEVEEPDVVVALAANPVFIEAFLAGLNHELARELVWRGYPTDQRGTHFRRFFDGQRDELRLGLHEVSGNVGSHVSPGGMFVQLVRGELVRRYPNLIVTAARSDRAAVASIVFQRTVGPDILLVAEGVHQLAAHNLNRAAAALDLAAGSGTVSVEPEVLRTPTRGIPVTHRDLLLCPAHGPQTPGWNPNRPRTLAEPRLERWAAAHLGPAAEIVVGDGTLADRGVCALDIVYDAADLVLPPRTAGLARSLYRLLAASRPVLPADLVPNGDHATRAVALGELRARLDDAGREHLGVGFQITGETLNELLDMAKTMFGDDFRVLPLIAPGPDTPTTVNVGQSVIRRVIRDPATVCPGVARHAEVLLLADAARRPNPLQVAQFGHAGGWVGLPFGPNDPGPQSPVTSPVIDSPDGAGMVAGLVLDEWQEVLPRRAASSEDGVVSTVTSGLATNAKGPGARAPQAILLATLTDRPPVEWRRSARPPHRDPGAGQTAHGHAGTQLLAWLGPARDHLADLDQEPGGGGRPGGVAYDGPTTQPCRSRCPETRRRASRQGSTTVLGAGPAVAAWRVSGRGRRHPDRGRCDVLRRTGHQCPERDWRADPAGPGRAARAGSREHGRHPTGAAAARPHASATQIPLLTARAALMDAVMITTAAYTGMRWGELTGLQWTRVDHDAGVLVVDAQDGALHEVDATLQLGPPKTKASARTVHLPPFLTALLDQLHDSAPHARFVFTAPEGGWHRRANFRRRVWLPATVGDPQRGWKPIAPGLHFHDLRHTQKTWLIEDDVPEVLQCRRLGHRLHGVRGIYSHVHPTHDRRHAGRSGQDQLLPECSHNAETARR